MEQNHSSGEDGEKDKIMKGRKMMVTGAKYQLRKMIIGHMEMKIYHL